MASTTALLYTHMTGAGASATSRFTSAQQFIAFRTVSGRYSTGKSTAVTQKNWKPQSSVPLTDSNGNVTVPWEQFFRFLAEKKLGGANAHTLPQVEGFITYGQAQALIQTAVNAALMQQATANAQSLAAVVQVTQTAALPGAAQIPPVQLQAADITGAGGGD